MGRSLKGDIDDFDVSIDKYKLDEEWEDQPVLMHHYASLLAEARFAMDVAKSEHKRNEAELSAEIRASPSEFGLEKATENGIAAAVLTQPSFQRSELKYLTAVKRVGILTAIVDSIDHRKKALESLVYLHGQDYFGEPSAARAGASGMEKISNPPRAKGIRKRRED